MLYRKVAGKEHTMIKVKDVIEQREKYSQSVHPKYDLMVSEIKEIMEGSAGMGDMIINSFYCGYHRGMEAALYAAGGSR